MSKYSSISFKDAATAEYESGLGAVIDDMHKDIANCNTGVFLRGSYGFALLKVRTDFYSGFVISAVHTLPIFFGYNSGSTVGTYRIVHPIRIN